MKTIIAGSRSILDYELLKQTIKESGIKITHIISGGAKGVDTLAERYAKENNIPLTVVKAEWTNFEPPCVIRHRTNGPYNLLAGPIRNQKMANIGEALIALHNNSKGTKDMVTRAKKAKLVCFEKIVS